MKNQRNALLLFVMVFIITSCTTSPDYIDKAFILNKQSNMGVVVGSISQTLRSNQVESSSRIYSETNEYIGTISTEMPTIDKSIGTDIADIGVSLLISIPIAMLTGGKSGVVSVSSHKSLLSTDNDSEKEGVGYVFAIKLPPGKYYFKNWSVSDGPRANDKLERRDFIVNEGKIAYVGNLHMILGDVKLKFFKSYLFYPDDMNYNPFSIIAIESAKPVFRDKFERDIHVFRNFYPNLGNFKVDKNLVTLGLWELASP